MLTTEKSGDGDGRETRAGTHILVPDVQSQHLLLLVQVDDLLELHGELHLKGVVEVQHRSPELGARFVGV